MSALFVPLVFATTISVVLLFLLGVLLLHKKQGFRTEYMDTDNSLDRVFVWPQVVYDEDWMIEGGKIVVDNDCDDGAGLNEDDYESPKIADNDCDEDGRFTGDDCLCGGNTAAWRWVNYDGLRHGRLEDEVEDDKDDDDTDNGDEEPPLFVHADNDRDDDCDGLNAADDDKGIEVDDYDCAAILNEGYDCDGAVVRRLSKFERDSFLDPRQDEVRVAAILAAYALGHEQIDRSHGEHQPHLHCADGG